MGQGTGIGYFLVEVDGVAVCEASEVEMGGVKHEPFKIHTGTRPNPILGRNKYEVEEVKIKQAHALNSEGVAFARMFQDYILGVNVAKPTIRIVTLDEQGKTPVATDEFVECVPMTFVPENKKGEGGSDASYFSISFKPTDHIALY